MPLGTVSPNEQVFCNGYTIFRQLKNSSNARGYSQKSIVVMSELSFIDLFYTIGEIVTNFLYSNSNNFNLEEIYTTISNWPIPFEAGKLYNLSLMGQSIEMFVPENFYNYAPSRTIKKIKLFAKEESKELKVEHSTEIDETEELIERTSILLNKEEDAKIAKVSPKHTPARRGGSLRDILKTRAHFSGLYYEIPIAHYFKGAYLLALWNLWELVICEIPLLIFSKTPSHCSHIVLSLISLIAPLRFTGDYRPFITIYDSDINVFSKDHNESKLSNVIIGCSNPFFLKSFSSFPAIFHYEKSYYEDKGLKNPKTADINQVQAKKIKEKCLMVESKHKLLVKPFKPVLEQLSIKNCEEAEAINTWVIRKHFHELTHCFLSEFSSYFEMEDGYGKQYLFDKNFQINPLKAFDEKKFISALKKKDCNFNKKYLSSKDSTVLLYQRFINTKCFRSYLIEGQKNLLKTHDR